MKLIDRYVAEVGKRLLFVKGRQDIENELRSTLEDMLEDRARKSGQPADDALAMDLLKEYGAPQKTAETYNPHPYLIGPRVYPMFVMVLKIVLAAVALGISVASVIEIMAQSPMSALEFFSAVGKWLLGVLSAGVTAFGNIALIFAAVERFIPARELDFNQDEEWNPASLLKEPDPEEVKIWQPILGIALIFIAISVFNFNSHIIGVYYLDGGEWKSAPILSEAFFRWLPAINAVWIAEIILNGALLRAGRWQVSTRVFSVVVNLFQIGVILALMAGPSILALTPEALQTSGVAGLEAAQTISALAHQGVRIALWLAIFGLLIEIAKTAMKIFKCSVAKRIDLSLRGG